MLPSDEIIWFIIVPIITVVYTLLRRRVKTIGFTEFVAPFAILSIHFLSVSIYQFSWVPYMLFVCCLVGMMMWVYFYKRNIINPFGRFFRRFYRVIGNIAIIVWLIVCINRLVIIFI